MDESSDRRRVGEKINGAYEPVELLLSAEATACYRARDLRDGKTVTLTFLRPELALRQEAMQGFKSRAELVKKLGHEGLPALLAVESDDTGIPFAVEAYHQGEKLSEIMSRQPEGLPLDQTLRHMLPVMETLAEAHAAGLVHGRLGLDKVVVQEGGRGSYKVVDFLACYAPPGGRPDERSETARSFFSEAQEQAPERVKGGPPEPPADVWSLGVMLFKALSGKWPLETGSGGKGDSVRVKIRSLENLAPQLPAELCRVVDSCIKIRPVDRPADAAALGERLLPALRGAEGAAARPATDARGAKKAAAARPAAGSVHGRPNGGQARDGRGKPAPTKNRTPAGPDAARAQKARALALQIAKASQLGLRSESAPLPSGRPGRGSTTGGPDLAHKIARVLYTPITLDLVTDRGGGKRPAEAAAAAQPGGRKGRRGSSEEAAFADSQRLEKLDPAASDGARGNSCDELGEVMGGASMKALMKDRSMAGLLDADNLAVPMECDDPQRVLAYKRSREAARRAARAARESTTVEGEPPIDYRLPVGRILLRGALYGLCLLAIVGAYIFYREVASEDELASPQSTQRGFSGRSVPKPSDEERPDDGKASADGDGAPKGKAVRTAEQDELGDVESAHQTRDRFKNPLFGK